MNDGGPAFPRQLDRDDSGGVVTSAEYGMSLRDWFAGKALQSGISVPPGVTSRWQYIAEEAYRQADAMLAEREKK